jgi:hypothetical protein
MFVWQRYVFAKHQFTIRRFASDAVARLDLSLMPLFPE